MKNEVKTDTGNGKKGTSDKERYIIRGKKKPKNNLMISLEFRLTFRRQTFWAVYFSIFEC